MPSQFTLPANFKLPPYRPPCLSPTPLPFRKPHSARKSTRRARIFPYYHRLPTTATACARFRLARKEPPATVHATSEVEKLRTHIDAGIARIDARALLLRAALASLRAQVIGHTWQLHQLASGRVPLTAISTQTFLPHLLAPDR